LHHYITTARVLYFATGAAVVMAALLLMECVLNSLWGHQVMAKALKLKTKVSGGRESSEFFYQ
jgi:hypothetical protein